MRSSAHLLGNSHSSGVHQAWRNGQRANQRCRLARRLPYTRSQFPVSTRVGSGCSDMQNLVWLHRFFCGMAEAAQRRYGPASTGCVEAQALLIKNDGSSELTVLLRVQARHCKRDWQADYKRLSSLDAEPLRFLGSFTDGGCDDELNQYWVSLPCISTQGKC